MIKGVDGDDMRDDDGSQSETGLILKPERRMGGAQEPAKSVMTT